MCGANGTGVPALSILPVPVTVPGVCALSAAVTAKATNAEPHPICRVICDLLCAVCHQGMAERDRRRNHSRARHSGVTYRPRLPTRTKETRHETRRRGLRPCASARLQRSGTGPRADDGHVTALADRAVDTENTPGGTGRQTHRPGRGSVGRAHPE